jgi:hypothetical protein
MIAKITFVIAIVFENKIVCQVGDESENSKVAKMAEKA